MKIQTTPVRLQPRHRLKSCAFTLAITAALLTFTAKAADIEWQGGTASYTNAADWVGGIVPGPGDQPINSSGINNIVQINVGDPDWTVGDLSAGGDTGASGAFEQNGQTLNVNGWFHIGDGTNSVGIFTINGGTLNNTNSPSNQFFLGEGPGSTSILNVNGGTINIAGPFDMADADWNGLSPRSSTVNQTAGTLNANGVLKIGSSTGSSGVYNFSGGIINMSPTADNQFIIATAGGDGSGGNGTLNMSGNALLNSPAAEFWIGNSGGSTGIANLSNNAVVMVNNWIAPGRGGTGTLNIYDNASVTKTGNGNITIGSDLNGDGNGTVNQYGGFVTNTTSQTWIGESATGTWNMESGSAFLGQVNICQVGAATGNLNLDGGVFQATGINSSTIGYSTLSFNGGILQAGANNANFLSGLTEVDISSAGAVIDSQNYDITIPQDLPTSGDTSGGLTKNGSGTLTLTGNLSYSGDTIINQGTLYLIAGSSSGSGNYIVADNAGLGILVQSSGAQLKAQQNLTLGSSAGAVLDFDLGNFGNPTNTPLNISDTLTVNGTTTVNIADALPQPGQFPLIKYGTLAGSGNFVIGSLPAGMEANIVNDTENNSIDLDVTAVNEPRWNGNVSGDWDIGLTENWINIGTDDPTFYNDGNPVVFDDNATGTTTVNLTTTVNPNSVTVTNNSLSYTFVGSGKISGATGLEKQGTSALAILNTGGNNYTGATVISGGTLSVTNLANGGSPSAIGASSADAANLVIGNATFTYGGSPVSVNRGFTINGSSAAIDTEGNLALSGAVAVTSTGGFTKTGPAQLTLTDAGDNEFSGGSGPNPGAQVVNGTLLLDGSAGDQVNHTRNDFYVGDTTATGASLILSNTTLNVDGWFGVGRINGGINNTSTAILYNSSLTAGNLTFGWDGGQPNNLASQFLTLNGNSTVTDNGSVNLCEGTGSTLTVNINDNSILKVQNAVFIALASSSTSTVVVANSGQIIQTGGWFDIGQGNNSLGALIAKDNANISLDGDLNLGDTGSSTISSLTVQDNAQITNNQLFIAKGSANIGTVNISGSAAITERGYVDIGVGSGATGVVNLGSVSQPGGSLVSEGDMTVGDSGTGTLNLVTNGNGTLTVYGTLYLSRSSQAADGTVNLNAGSTIIASYVNNGWGFHNNYPTATDNPNAFNFNGGTLKSYSGANPAYPLIQPYVNAVVQSGGAIIDDGGAVRYVAASLVDGGGGGGLTKLGSGTLLLNATNTYTGATLVNAGALAGTGSVAGSVTVASGATLAAGSGSVGTFTINGNLTFSAGSTAFMKITPTNNDQIAGLTEVTYNGSLIVTNTSDSLLTVGSTFKLFNSTTAGSGNFVSVTILPMGSGTFDPATGELTITSSGVFMINPPVISGGNLILTGSGGTADAGYTLLTSTNLTTPLADWTTNTTGTLDDTGAFSNSVPVNSSDPVRFFNMRTP